MKEFFVEKKRNEYLDYFGMDAKKFQMQRIVLGVLLTVLTLIIAYATGKVMLYAAVPVAGILGYKMQYFGLVSNKKHADMVKTFVFPQFLRYFIALLGSQGNVYQTLRATVPYLREPLKSRVEQFVDEIEEENEYEKYLEFAEYIGTSEAHMVMGMIYNFSEHGVIQEELEELERMIDKINENKTDQMVLYKATEQEKYMNMPIFSGLFFVMSFVVIIIVYNLMTVSGFMQF